LLIIVLLGYLAYQQLFRPALGEEKQVKALENRFDGAVERFVRAHRTAAETRLDTTSDVDESADLAKKIRDELSELKAGLKSQAAIDRANKLEAKINSFFKKNQII
jgi:hypothetical protein